MRIRTSSGSRLRLGGNLFSGVPAATAGVGQIFRVVNDIGITSDSLDYTKIDGSPGNTGTITSGSFVYILAKSGSLSDSNAGNDGQLIVINLLITSSVDEIPSFTEELITTTGAGSWTKPLGVTQVIVECWGGGGAGGGATVSDTGAGGGAGGQYSRKLIEYDPAETSISYSIAASVAGGTGNGTTGEDTTWDTNIVIAKGGQGGEAGASTAAGGIATTVDGVGDVVYTGYSGGEGLFNTPFVRGGEGGRGGGSSNNSPFGINAILEYGGEEAAGIDLSSGGSNGNPGNNYGGGGGGAAKVSGPNRTGGAGAQGLIRLIYR